MSVRLDSLANCFQGVIPSLIATCSRTGEPNVTYLSQVFYLDEQHVALSCQFFNKTRRNVEENPYAAIVFYDPVTFEAWRLHARYLRSETCGPVFDTMAARIQVIASHTGMAGVFRLLSADIYEVLSLESDSAFLLPHDPVHDAQPAVAAAGPLSELRALQVVSERISAAADLPSLLSSALTALDEMLGFTHSMVFLLEPCGKAARAAATRGYGAVPCGPEVALGAGIIGTVAEHRRMIKVAGMGQELRYGRAIRERVAAERVTEELPLPGLADAQAQLGLPLMIGSELLGVLAMESADPLCFDEWDEVYLQIIANQVALGIARMRRQTAAPAGRAGAAVGARARAFRYFPDDDCVFVDGEYLVRNLPGRILWKLLMQWRHEGRTEFTNRELRLDPSLQLPPIKDNLESRLILLRKRLQERCPDVRIVPIARGRFALQIDCEPTFAEPPDSNGTS